jgi:hypothetical protein
MALRETRARRLRAGAWSSSVDSLASLARGNPSRSSAHDRYGDGGGGPLARAFGGCPGATRVDGFECPLVVRVVQAGATADRIALLGCDEVGNPGLLCSPGRVGGLKGVMVPVLRSLRGSLVGWQRPPGHRAVACYRRPHQLRPRDRRKAPSRPSSQRCSRTPIVDPNSGDESV